MKCIKMVSLPLAPYLISHTISSSFTCNCSQSIHLNRLYYTLLHHCYTPCLFHTAKLVSVRSLLNFYPHPTVSYDQVHCPHGLTRLSYPTSNFLINSCTSYKDTSKVLHTFHIPDLSSIHLHLLSAYIFFSGNWLVFISSYLFLSLLVLVMSFHIQQFFIISCPSFINPFRPYQNISLFVLYVTHLFLR